MKKWLIRTILFFTALTIATFIWVDHEIEKMWGGNTVVVEHTKFGSPQIQIAIKEINVLSPDGSTMLANQTVIIEKGIIQSIGPNASVSENASVINGKGKYLIPGLIDSHVHLWQSPNDLLLYVANGVTHIRELNGSEDHLRWKQEIKDGRIGPNLFVASSRLNSNSRINGWFAHWTAKMTSVNAPENAEAILQSFSKETYDAVKIYSKLSKEDFFAVDKAAENISIPILGHIPMSVGLKEIWKSNLREIAHIEELVKALDREFGGYDEDNAKEFLQFVRDRGNDVTDHLFENEMAVVTTLWLMESLSKQRHALHSALEEIELDYVNPGITELSPLTSRVMGWLPDSNIYRISNDYTTEKLSADKTYWDTYVKANHILLKFMVNKGITVLAGTDANVPTVVPGFSMHDELKSLTASGMSPAQALFSATAAPANWMKAKSGRVAPGYNADLVLLNASPLENIENTKTIDTVIVNGRIFNRKLLDEMLDAVKEANDNSRTVDVSKYKTL